jgi:hypothetical protein
MAESESGHDATVGASDEIVASARSHRTLEDVVRWGIAHRPPWTVDDVVVQDEFTHDVVVRCRDDLYLVYDTT